MDLSGYAAAARGYIAACNATGIDIRVYDRSRSVNLKNKGMDSSILDTYERLKNTAVAPDCPAVQHQVPDAFFADAKTRMSIGYTIFEMTRVPDAWVGPCNSMDVIWTGSEYSREAFLASGVKTPVKVLPHALDLEAYAPDGPAWEIENRRSFAFLSVFDFTARKAWKDLLRAYWTAFGPKDDVCLVLKVYYGDFSDDARKDVMYRILKYRREIKMENRAPILVYAHDVPGVHMPSLYRSADCYVGISREGFGLTYCEAMACGLPAIGPEVGGTRQFMTHDNSYLVSYLGNEPIDKEVEYMFPSFSGLTWAKHSWKDLSVTMRRVMENEEERKKVAQRGCDDVRKSLGYEAIGNRIKKLLS